MPLPWPKLWVSELLAGFLQGCVKVVVDCSCQAWFDIPNKCLKKWETQNNGILWKGTRYFGLGFLSRGSAEGRR